jgi:hypothetical protein
VIEITRREVGGDGNLAHAGGSEAAAAENTRGSAQNGDASRLGTAS